MDDRAWRTGFGIMSIPLIIDFIFLFVNSTDWIFTTNAIVLILSFFLFVAARVWEMKGIDVALIMIANIITLILNLLFWLKVL